MRQRYRNISIPEELYNEITSLIKKSKLSYRSRTEFIIDAIRRLITEIKK